jgi:hypothetical protein
LYIGMSRRWEQGLVPSRLQLLKRCVLSKVTRCVLLVTVTSLLNGFPLLNSSRRAHLLGCYSTFTKKMSRLEREEKKKRLNRSCISLNRNQRSKKMRIQTSRTWFIYDKNLRLVTSVTLQTFDHEVLTFDPWIWSSAYLL